MDLSTWFNPIILEVLIIPVSVLLGTLSALVSRTVIVGPFIYIAVTITFYCWILIQFYSFDTSAFFTVHMNSYEIDIFFTSVTWIFSWVMVKAKQFNFNKPI